MTTLYLDRRDLSLRLDGRALAIYAGDERQGTVPLHLLESIVMRSSVTLSSSVLARLAEAGVGILAFGGRGARSRAIVHGPAHNDGARRIGQYRRYDDPVWRLAWSRRLVRGKLRRQQRLLTRAAGQRPDLRRPLTRSLDQLAAALRHAAAPEIDDVDRLRGIEGAAAAAYFSGFTRLFPPALDFTGRNRRPPRDPVNAVLSLGYTLLHYEAVRACHGAGLDPIIGYYHALDFGRESLACDLIEPLRPRLDAWSWQQFHDQVLRADHFSRDGDGCLLGKTGRRHFYAAFEPFIRPHRRLLHRMTRGLATDLARAGADAPTQGDPR